MKRCPTCNKLLLLRTKCPNCVRAKDDSDDFDVVGFATGMMTGVPLSPTHGFSSGALLGAALHHDDTAAASVATPSDPIPSAPAPTGGGGDFGGGGASSDYSSSDSSGSSSDYSGGSSGGGSSGGSD